MWVGPWARRVHRRRRGSDRHEHRRDPRPARSRRVEDDRGSAGAAGTAAVTLQSQVRLLGSHLGQGAGAVVIEGRRTGAGTFDTKSTTTDLVTEYDRASERLIVNALRATRADD